jgi:hypothetical protein
MLRMNKMTESYLKRGPMWGSAIEVGRRHLHSPGTERIRRKEMSEQWLELERRCTKEWCEGDLGYRLAWKCSEPVKNQNYLQSLVSWSDLPFEIISLHECLMNRLLGAWRQRLMHIRVSFFMGKIKKREKCCLVLGWELCGLIRGRYPYHFALLSLSLSCILKYIICCYFPLLQTCHWRIKDDLILSIFLFYLLMF